MKATNLAFKRRDSLLLSEASGKTSQMQHGVYRVAEEAWQPEMFVSSISCPHLVLFLITRGHGQWDHHAATTRLAPGMVFCYPRDGRARVACDSSDPLQVRILELTPELWTNRWDELINGTGWACPLADPALFENILQQLFNEAKLQQTHVERQLALLAEQALIYLARELPCHMQPHLSTHTLCERAHALLQAGAEGKQSVNDVAQTLTISAAHLSRIFKARYGCSPLSFLNTCKMQRATRILKEEPGITLNELANLLGYSDAFAFSRAFKKNIGSSPAHYRKQVRI